MVYFKKTYPAPESLEKECIKNNGSYKEKDVLEQLYVDFHNKCYICESKGLESINIEHFAPHKDKNRIRKYNWSNLFWACSHCNQIKSDSEPLLNCTIEEDKVDENIRYYIDDNFAENKIVIESLLTNIEIDNSVELLIKVYNGTTIQNKFQAREKRNKLYDDVCDFTNFIQKYLRTEDMKKKKQLLEAIKGELSNQSAFTAFKRWIIRDNSALLKEFREYIGG
ncbi:MAG: Unknown protein [uncultured Sulfurovum sp.]|uniref:HNH domain-containing protein n=1 Tax=uncultured Sulfurovum sp. TaxID=269237 RepID=A0A6S6S5J5_9BACT|nr:MAG: Unknown protein [uncultured Sulfurovum sp.]